VRTIVTNKEVNMRNRLMRLAGALLPFAALVLALGAGKKW
jgi:hypothetical protein